MNTRQKMHITNSKIRKWLVENEFEYIYFFPHLRFQKDYHLEDLSFDGIAWKNKLLYLMQFKTNVKPSQKILEQYREVGQKYGCKLVWITTVKGNGVVCYG